MTVDTRMLDTFNSLASPDATKGAFHVVNAVQEFSAGKQVASISIVFLEICKYYGIDPRDALDKSRYIIEDALSTGRGEHIRAIKDYVKGELTK